MGRGKFITKSIEKIIIISELDICLNILKGCNDKKIEKSEKNKIHLMLDTSSRLG